MPDLLTRTRSALADRYTIHRELGRGGMGTVFLAEDRKHSRSVAIKVVHPERASPPGLDHFLREIRTTARLQHPHILPLHDSGAFEGLLYFVMPHVEGESLRERLRFEGTLAVDEVLRISRQIADALEYAHSHGVVHRDVKPDNILLSGNHAFLADFGIANALKAPTGDQLTNTGFVVGTPTYMSPEQAMGHRVDGRADQYALACVTFEMLAGCLPFDAHMEPGEKLRSEPKPVSKFRSGLGRSLDRVLQRAMSGSATDRYATVTEFAEALSHAASGESHEARNELPPQPTSFVGRDAEILKCRGLLDETRLLSLTGVGGTGKTRLALRLVEDVLEQFPDGVWLVDLTSIAEAERVVSTVAKVLDVKPEPGDSYIHALAEHLAPKRALLLLDNCEHVLRACAELADALLRSCGELKIVVTSREAFGEPGELDYVVPPLSLPPPEPEPDPARIESADSVRLFVERAAFVRPGFRLTHQNASVVAEICLRLDGIPLAIELAAARVRVLSVQEIRDRLTDRFRLLVNRGQASPRHRALRATLQWSYGQLSEDEGRLFRFLAVFGGGWTLSGATAVFDDEADEYEVVELLTRLVDKSLVVVDPNEAADSRYWLLETVRQFANELLDEAGEKERARCRHFEYFSRRAAEIERMLQGDQQAIGLARLELDHENLLSALAWCEATPGGGHRALRMASTLWRFWYARGHGRLGLQVLLRILSREGNEEGTPERIEALLGAGLLALDQGDYVVCRRIYEEALALTRERGDRGGIARALNGLGAVVGDGEGNYESAVELLEQSLVLNRELGNTRAEGIVLSNMGEAALRLGRFADARALCQDSLRCRRQAGDLQGIGITQLNAALASLRLGDVGEASRQLAEALDRALELGQRPLGANALDACAELLGTQGDLHLSAVFAAAADALREGGGSRRATSERVEADDHRDRLRRNLGEGRYAAALREGRNLSFKAALSLALKTLQEKFAHQ